MRERLRLQARPGAPEVRRRRADPAPDHPLLALQRHVGNAAVTSVLARPDGAAERRADRLAATVVRRLGLRSGERATVGPHVAPEDDAPVDDRLAARIDRSTGRRMDDGLRARMERGFGGADFGHVRLHRGVEADDLARSLDAKAFTKGRDVFLRDDAGPDVLAHELAHVTQSSDGAIHRFWDIELFKARTKQKGAGKSSAQRRIGRLLVEYSTLEEGGSVPPERIRAAIDLLDEMEQIAEGWLDRNKSEKDGTRTTKSRAQRGAGMREFLGAVERERTKLRARQDGPEERHVRIREPIRWDDVEDEQHEHETNEGPGTEPEPEAQPGEDPEAWRGLLIDLLYRYSSNPKALGLDGGLWLEMYNIAMYWKPSEPRPESLLLLEDVAKQKIGGRLEPLEQGPSLIEEDFESLLLLEEAPKEGGGSDPTPLEQVAQQIEIEIESGETEDEQWADGSTWRERLAEALREQGLDVPSGWSPDEWEMLQKALVQKPKTG